MAACRCPGQTLPNLLKPFSMLRLRYDAKHTSCDRRLSIPARLPLHQHKFDVILDDGIRLVGLSQESRPVLDLVGSIRDLVPDKRCEIVEAYHPAVLLNRR